MLTRTQDPTQDLAQKPLSRQLAEQVTLLEYDQIPVDVRERAKYLALDSIGIALASTHYDFAHRTLSGLSMLGGVGGSSVIGMSASLPLRDAVFINGLLVHGLDYDDTHIRAIVHPSSSALPCALAMCEHMELNGQALLASYILGVEVSTRIGLAAKGAFHEFGFHPTGIAAHFACALQAGWLHGLTAHQLTMAQGIVGSTASGSQEFLEEGAWNKRIHPGWAGVAGITAAALAQHGFVGPTRVYEGRFGLFKSHLHEKEAESDYSQITSQFGTRWEIAHTSVKPFPFCHLIHACADSTLILMSRENLQPEDVAYVRAKLPAETLHIVAEPESNKLAPANSYDAKFSAQFVIGACLARGRFGLAELEADALKDPTILDLASKVRCEADPDAPFPEFFSGGVVIGLRNGQTLEHYERVNRGAGDRALSEEDIIAKFAENAAMSVSNARARAIQQAILQMEGLSAVELASVLRG